MFEPRSNNFDRELQYIQEYMAFCRSVIFRQDRLNHFIEFLNFLSQKPYLIDVTVKEYLKEFMSKLDSQTHQCIIERVNIICGVDTLFDFDVTEINALVQQLRIKEEYIEVEKNGKSDNFNDPYGIYEIAYRLTRYLYKDIPTLYESYEKDRTRHTTKLVVKSHEVLLDEKLCPLTLLEALELQSVNKIFVEYIRQNLHQDGILGICAVDDRYLSRFTTEMIEDFSEIKKEIEVIIDPQHPNILDIRVIFYRTNNLGQKVFEGNFVIRIEDINQASQAKMENSDVKVIDFKFRLAEENLYEIILNYKIDCLLKKIISQSRLSPKEQNDIQIILLPYLKFKDNQKILSVKPEKIKNINIIYLLLSQGYIIEACAGLKNRNLSSRENIKFKTLLNISLFNYDENAGEEKDLKKIVLERQMKKEKICWPPLPAGKPPLSTTIQEAARPLNWWLTLSQKILPDSMLNMFSFFQPVIDKNKANIELENTAIEEYFTFLSMASPEDAEKIWQEKLFISKVRKIIQEFNQHATGFIGSKKYILTEPLCTDFFKLVYLSRQSNNKKFEGLEKNAARFMRDIFWSVNNVVINKFVDIVPNEMDFERLELFKKILKTDEFFSIFEKIINFQKKSDQIEKILPGVEDSRILSMNELSQEYSRILLKWVETYKDPELMQLIFERPDLSKLLDDEAFAKIASMIKMTSTPVPQLEDIWRQRAGSPIDASIIEKLPTLESPKSVPKFSKKLSVGFFQRILGPSIPASPKNRFNDKNPLRRVVPRRSRASSFSSQ